MVQTALKKIERVCHFHKLSIRNNGDIFPCCVTSGDRMLVGNVFNDNVVEQIRNKSLVCECPLYKMRPPKKGEVPTIKYLHLELSHKCQSQCICCFQDREDTVDVDKFKNKIENLLKEFTPEFMIVIGGEILVQQDSLAWLEKIKSHYPQIKFDIVTNLCVSANIIKRAAVLFDFMTVSFLGFQAPVYNCLMHLDFERTLSNFNYLLDNTTVRMRPKFLAMPSNIIDIPLFLDYFINKEVEKIYIHNTNEFKDCVNFEQKYWDDIFDRLGVSVRKILKDNKNVIISKNRHFISLHSFLSEKMGVTSEFLREIGLDSSIAVTA